MEQRVAQVYSGAIELREYLGALRRRMRPLVLIALLVTAAAVAVAYLIPPLYRSQAMISIESQEVPDHIVATTVSGYVQERLGGLKTRLLTPDRLWTIASAINLFPDKLEESGRGAVLSAMERGIEVEPVDIRFSAPQSGNTGTATVAFTISFLADTPEKARRGTTMLAELFMEEERRSRTRQTAEVSKFLTEQANILSNKISKLEAKLSDFKQKNVPRLPEFIDLNMRLLEQTDDKLARTDERIRALRERQIYLESQLATTDRYAPIVGREGQTVLAPGQRLKLLRSEYLRLSATYSPDHPDIERLRREMEVLESETGAASEAVRLIKERERLRRELAEVRQRYSNEHPDVRRLTSTISKLEAEIAKIPIKSAPAPQQAQAPPDNPPYIRLQTELDALKVNLKAEKEQRGQIMEKRGELEQRLFQSPVVEQEYLELSRDYQNAVDRYREIKDKQLMAEAAERLENEQKSQRFRLLRKAYLPKTPDQPNRFAIILIGVFLGTTGGVSWASLAEYLDQTVRGARGVMGAFGAPPIATIPRINSSRDVRRRRLRAAGLTLSLLIMMAVAISLLHTFWKPMEEWLPAGDTSGELDSTNRMVDQKSSTKF